jgi:hypothetical protein
VSNTLSGLVIDTVVTTAPGTVTLTNTITNTLTGTQTETLTNTGTSTVTNTYTSTITVTLTATNTNTNTITVTNTTYSTGTNNSALVSDNPLISNAATISVANDGLLAVRNTIGTNTATNTTADSGSNPQMSAPGVVPKTQPQTAHSGMVYIALTGTNTATDTITTTSTSLGSIVGISNTTTTTATAVQTYTVQFPNATHTMTATMTVTQTDICSNVAGGIPCLDTNTKLSTSVIPAHATSHVTGSDQLADATTSVHGLMLASDKTKIDGVATGATNTPLSNATPATEVIGGSGVVGTATSASRGDHVHPFPTITPTTVGLGNVTNDAQVKQSTTVSCSGCVFVYQTGTMTATATATATNWASVQTVSVTASGTNTGTATITYYFTGGGGFKANATATATATTTTATTSITLDASNLVPKTQIIAGHTLTNTNVAISADDVAAANKALSNLSGVSVSQSLVPSSSAKDLGSSGTPWGNLFIKTLSAGTPVGGVYPFQVDSSGIIHAPNTICGHALNGNVVCTASDVGAVPNTILSTTPGAGYVPVADTTGYLGGWVKSTVTWPTSDTTADTFNTPVLIETWQPTDISATSHNYLIQWSATGYGTQLGNCSVSVEKNYTRLQASGAGVAFVGAAFSMSGIISTTLTNSDVIKMYVWPSTEAEVCNIYGSTPGFPTSSISMTRIAN